MASGPPSKRRHLGRHQRAALSSGADDTVITESALVKDCLKRWAWGEYQATDVQRVCALACEDMEAMLNKLKASHSFMPRSLVQMAGLGDHGKYPGNCKRDLLQILGDPSGISFDLVQIPLVIAKGMMGPREKVKEVPLPIFPPDKVISNWYRNHRSHFDQMLFGEPHAEHILPNFWKTVAQRKDPRLANHPMCSRPNWFRHAIPISVHGDAVPAVGVGKAASKSWDCISWQSCLVNGPSTKVKQYMVGLFEDSKLRLATPTHDQTMKHIWKTCLSSLSKAYEGIQGPTDDEPGDMLAGGFFLVVWAIKGDLDYLQKGLQLKSYTANQFCEYCPAHSDEADPSMMWSNFRDDAAWMQRLYTKDQWHGEHPEKHWLFQAFDFLTQHNIEPDELHVMYLGTVQQILGSVLWIFCFLVLPHEPAVNCDMVFDTICQHYQSSATAAQYSNFGLASFLDTDHAMTTYPKLKGKGAEARDLVGPVLHAWEQHANPTSYEYARIRSLLQKQLEAQTILSDYSKDVFLPVAAADRFDDLVKSLLQDYTKLANRADRENKVLWPMTPKWHWLWHLSSRARFMNPRVGCCMVDEDYVGHLKRVVSASVHGTPLHAVPLKVAEKIRWSMHFSLS